MSHVLLKNASIIRVLVLEFEGEYNWWNILYIALGFVD